MITNYVPGADMAKRRDISTATIYATPEEWQAFKNLSAAEDRREAAQLVALAKRAAENPDAFRLIRRQGKPAYQIKTAAANEYLKILADAVDPSGERVTLSDVVESLIRGLSVQ
jgi:hypothetical protein